MKGAGGGGRADILLTKTFTLSGKRCLIPVAMVGRGGDGGGDSGSSKMSTNRCVLTIEKQNRIDSARKTHSEMKFCFHWGGWG